MCAASPANRIRPHRYSVTCRVASLNRLPHRSLLSSVSGPWTAVNARATSAAVTGAWRDNVCGFDAGLVAGHGEMTTGRLLRDGALGHRVEQPPHRQHFRRARVDPTAAGLTTRCGLPLDHLDGHPGQGQFTGQHQPGRACTDDDYISFVSPRNFSTLGAEYPGSGIYVDVAAGYVFEKQLPAT